MRLMRRGIVLELQGNGHLSFPARTHTCQNNSSTFLAFEAMSKLLLGVKKCPPSLICFSVQMSLEEGLSHVINILVFQIVSAGEGVGWGCQGGQHESPDLLITNSNQTFSEARCGSGSLRSTLVVMPPGHPQNASTKHTLLLIVFMVHKETEAKRSAGMCLRSQG